MTLAVEAAGLVKSFGKTLAVDGVDLAVPPGRVLGLLGPNGAGKTTVVRMLATLLRPDAGSARVCGADILTQADRVRELIGLTGQYAAVDEDLRGHRARAAAGQPGRGLHGPHRPQCRSEPGRSERGRSERGRGGRPVTASTAASPDWSRKARTMTPARALRHAMTLAWRSLVRIRRNPEQLLDVTLQPIIFVTLFVFLFGGAIKGESRHTYLQYVLPGIMVMTVLFSSMGTGIGLNTDVSKGIFDRFRSLPISRSAPLTGTIMGDFFRYLISIAMVFGYGSLLGFRIATNPLSALGAAGLMFVFGFALGWIWVLLGLYVKSPQSLQGFGFIVMFPLAFGSNVFIQTVTLPGWLQAWVRVNPVTELTAAARGLMLGSPVATPAWHSVAWSIALTAVFAPLAVRRYRRIG
jgi:oleandomycin transport system permease protein